MDRSLLRRIAAVLAIAGFIAISHSSAWAQAADLAVSMSADRLKAKIGEHVVYRILLTNLGPDAAAGVGLFVNLGDQLDSVCFICAGTPTLESGCSIGTVASGASVESILVVRVSNTFGMGGRFPRLPTVSAEVSSTTSDPNSNNNSAVVGLKIIGAPG